ncbi:MAG: relaxase/mobilization nuclease domain-containing protein [Ruminococcus sp.]|nr:relaxase/mobilization nuclease domain-containing protein [Ruminococcus sp.]
MLSVSATVSAAIAYITRDDKTVNGIYVNSYACRADSAGASEDFRTVRGTGTGRTQILAYHMIQSFAPGEVTPEQAMQNGEELCDRYLKGDYQYVIAVHNDKDHLHCHIIFNNTNLYNGLSFTTEHNQGRKSERAWAELRDISDEICAEHGISVIEPIGKGVSHYENEMQKEGKSWKEKLRVRIAEVMLYSRDFDDFLNNCTSAGIEYVYTPQNKYKLKFKLSGDGQQRFTRAETLGEGFTVKSITDQIAEIQEKLSAENVTPDMLIEPPKPVVRKTEPKPTKTVTAPTNLKHSAKPETITETSKIAKRKAAAEQVEKFFAARRARRQAQFDMLNSTATKLTEPKSEPSALTPQPTPAESKAHEKEEDQWEAIRGGRADEIIADLESGGVMSFSELSRFFFNTPHDDDQTTELADLRKKFTAIDTLIAKMKHRDELEPVHKEYQGKSGWEQSRFKKKNAATIEDYEQTVKYIKEHIKEYAVDGKPPTMLDLLEKSNKLKSKWNRLNVEHTAFLTKRETAKKYTRHAYGLIHVDRIRSSLSVVA